MLSLQRVTALILAIFLFSATAVRSQGKSFSLGSHASIRLPVGWSKVSDAQMRVLQNVAKQNGITLTSPGNTYVFSPGIGMQSFPYITVIDNSRTIPPVKDVDELLDQIKAGLKSTNDREVLEQTGGLIQGTAVEDVYYEEKRKSVGFRLRMNGDNGTTIVGVSEIFFRRGGYIQLNFYSGTSYSSADEQLFESIADGVEIPTMYQFNPIGASRLAGIFSQLSPRGKIGLWVIFFSIIGGLVERFLSAKRHHAPRPASRIRGYAPRPQAQEDLPPPEPDDLATPVYRTPKVSAQDPALEPIRNVVQGHESVTGAQLFEEAQGPSSSLVLAITLKPEVPLRQQQQVLKLLRAQISNDVVSQIVRYEAVASSKPKGQGLSLLRAPTTPGPEESSAKPKKKRAPATDEDRIELQLE